MNGNRNTACLFQDGTSSKKGSSSLSFHVQQLDTEHLKAIRGETKRKVEGMWGPDSSGASQVAPGQRIHLPVQEMQKTWVQSPGQEDALEEEIATHSSVLAWEIPRSEELGGLQSRGAAQSQTQLSMNSSRGESCLITQKTYMG